MRAFLAFFLALLTSSPAFGESAFPGPSGTLSTITSKGLLVGEKWVTNDRDNYVQNSDAFKAVTGVTASGTAATVTRNTTTPLGEVADFSINLGTSAAGYVEWNVRTLPAGLAGQSCALMVQAQTLSLGSATVEWQVVQSSIVVARITATVTSVPLPVSLPVSCGASAALAATKIRVAHTAYTSGTTALKVTGVEYGDARALGVITDAANITAWQTYTCSGFLTTNATYSCKYRRVGDVLDGAVTIAFSGANTQGAVTFTDTQLIGTLGLSPDTSKLSINSGDPYLPLGNWAGLDSGSSGQYGGQFVRNIGTPGTWYLTYSSGATSASQVNTNTPTPFTYSNGDQLSVRFSVPIANWTTASSAVTPAQSQKTRVEYNTAAGQSLPVGGAVTIVDYGSLVASQGCGTVTTGASWRFTPCESGWYSVTASALFASTTWTAGDNILMYLYKTGTAKKIVRWAAPATFTNYSPSPQISADVFLSTSDYLDVRIEHSNTGGAKSLIASAPYNTISIAQIDGPSQAYFIRSPMQAASTGVAPLTGEVNNTITGALSVQTATRSTAGSTATTIGTISVPSAGCYEFVLQDNVFRSAFGAASSSGFGGLRILNSTDSLTVAEDTNALYMSNTSGDLEAAFTASIHLSAVRCYTSAKTIVAQIVSAFNGGSGVTIQNRALGAFYAKNLGDR